MLRLTLAQMRRSVGRLTAAGIAIAIGTAFVAATLLASNVMARTSHTAIAASYADADLVVTATSLTDEHVTAFRELDGVTAAQGHQIVMTEFAAHGNASYLAYQEVAADPRLEPQVLVEGQLPAGPGEVALPVAVAERLDLTIGDALEARNVTWADDEPEEVVTPLTLVGTLDDPRGAHAMTGGAAIVAPEDAAEWVQLWAPDQPREYSAVVVLLAAGVDRVDAVAAMAQVAPTDAAIRTVDEQAAVMASELTGGTNLFTALVLGFAAIALLVAALVISNTFQVLVAQRTRTLALLRCVGATAAQLRRSVLIESTLLGLTASAIGLLTGTALAQGTLVVLSRQDVSVPLPTTVTITPAVVIAPLAVGTVVTVIAAVAPARAASRVAPLAALRPANTPRVSQRAGRGRFLLSLLLTVGGFGLLGAGLALSQAAGAQVGLPIGLIGGALSFVGVLVGAVFWLPRVVGAAGRLLARLGGPSTSLAAANSVRNPRRTAATSSALLIGVTLVAMMSTGAANASAALGEELDGRYPVDVAVEQDAWTQVDGSGLTPALVQAVAEVRGVAEVLPIPSALVEMHGTTTAEVPTIGIDPAEAVDVVRSPDLLTGLDEGAVLLSRFVAGELGVTDGDTVQVGGQPLAVIVTALDDYVAAVTPARLREAAPDTSVGRLWVSLTDVSEAQHVVPTIQDVVAEVPVAVSGAAVERAMFQRVIDTLLAIVVGLLGVAVVIALIGVANTLSLSVIERRRESATLRAIGLTREQLRVTLAVEGMLIAGVGAALGTVLGTVYGWVGARTVLAGTPFGIAVPWSDLALVVGVALLAGLLASVLPARSAVRTPPVAALAIE